MPAFHRAASKENGFIRVHKDCVGFAMMSAEDVEDVVAYLATLK